jgi:hypothetical protein
VLLYENEGALPRAYLSYRSVRAEGTEALARWLGRDFDARRTSVFEGEAPALEGPPGIDAVHVTRSAPERLELAVAPEQPALLIVTDAWHPGWRAWVDGREVAVMRVNAHFRGVALRGGAQHVEMRFEPWTWRAGRLVSLAASGVLLLLAGVGRARRRRRRI